MSYLIEKIYAHIKDLEKELIVTKQDQLRLAEEVYVLKKEYKSFMLGLDYPSSDEAVADSSSGDES